MRPSSLYLTFFARLASDVQSDDCTDTKGKITNCVGLKIVHRIGFASSLGSINSTPELGTLASTGSGYGVSRIEYQVENLK